MREDTGVGYKLHISNVRASPKEKINRSSNHCQGRAISGKWWQTETLFLFFSAHLLQKGSESSTHLHKHKYLLLWLLIAVIKAGIEWIRCLFT